MNQIDVTTDLQAFIALYKRFGIECKVSSFSDRHTIIIGKLYEWEQDDNPDWTFVEEKIDGYSGFYTEIAFDLDGKFLDQGIWE